MVSGSFNLACSASSSRTDFLKSFTAPPTSYPKFLSLDVPNKRMTTIANISTCQMDNPAMIFSSFHFQVISTVPYDKEVTLILQFEDSHLSAMFND